MRSGENFLALSRPLFYLILHSFYIVNTDSVPLLALYTVSMAFFLTSSAVINRWIPARLPWLTGLLYLEILWTFIFVLIMGFQMPNGPAAALFSPLFVTLFFDLERRWLKPTLILTTLLFLLSLAPTARYLSPSLLLFQAAIYGAFNLFSAAMGALMRHLRDEKERSEALLAQVRDSRTALERAHRQLTESAARAQEMAVLEERQRLAREIHDSVAHNLTALVVQIQVVRRLHGHSSQQPSTESLTRCEEMARHALLETRQAVRALHPAGLGGQSEVEALGRLGRDFGAATGIAVTVEADESLLHLPPNPNRLEQLYRIFQEAMTNAHRHGQAQRVTGRLALTENSLELTITNDGCPPANLDPGVGLRAMRERAASLGGSIAFEPEESGLTIRVTVPVKQEAVS